MAKLCTGRNICLLVSIAGFFSLFLLLTVDVYARNVSTYSDTITNSAPTESTNHTFRFTIHTDVAAGGYFEFDFPNGFTLPATSTFGVRNVEMLVNGTPRDAGSVLTAADDLVTITSGDGGKIRYTLNTTTGISSGSTVVLKVGNHTSNAYGVRYTYSTTTGTTTLPADIPPIENHSATGTYVIDMTVSGGSEPANADFHIAVVDAIGVGPVDTTETIPPLRFNGAPTGTLSGTTQNVELSVETDEFAVCKWGTTAGVAYGSMANTFDETGIIVHTDVVAVTTGSLNTFYVRCIDDEGNFNTDDYLIQFSVNDAPTGQASEDGTASGDGSGNNDAGDSSGTGSSGGGGGSSSGGSSGGGGSGGGSGGGTGSDSSTGGGGGPENTDQIYRSGDATVIIKGYAFPGSTVYALVDGAVVETDAASSGGSYEITIDAIAKGVYTFGVYAIDTNDVKSTTFSTSFTVTGARTSELTNINIMPSIRVRPDPVDIGQMVTVSGYSIPNAQITVENRSDKSSASLKTFTTTSNSSGAWSIEIDTAGFGADTYKVRAKAQQQSSLGITTNFSDYTYYGVGQEAETMTADLNTDGRVNLTDFSILLFWWGSDGGNSNPPADINRDGDVSLTDFSIMLFNWTG